MQSRYSCLRLAAVLANEIAIIAQSCNVRCSLDVRQEGKAVNNCVVGFRGPHISMMWVLILLVWI